MSLRTAFAAVLTGLVGLAPAAAQSPMTLTRAPKFLTPTATTGNLFAAVGTQNNGNTKAYLDGAGATRVSGGNPGTGFWNTTQRSWDVQWNQASGTATYRVYSDANYTTVASTMIITPPTNPNNTLVGIEFNFSVGVNPSSIAISDVEFDGGSGFVSVPDASLTYSYSPSFITQDFFALGGTLGNFTLRGKTLMTGTTSSDNIRFQIAGRQSLMRNLATPVVTTLPGSASPVDLALANFDGVAGTDFVAVGQVAAGPVLSVGKNIAGAFAAGNVTNISFGNTSGRPESIVAGNFDSNPGIDVAVLTSNIPPATTENKVYIFSNDGTGGFALGSTVTLTGMSAPSDLAVGNFDGGNDDLLVTDAGSGSLIAGKASVLLNGASGFTQSNVGSGYTRACRSGTVADVNGDTYADVVVVESNQSSGVMHVLLGNATGTAFTAMTGSPFATSNNGQDVAAADLDADGDADLAVCCTNDAFSLVNGAINVFANNGASGLARSDYNALRGPVAIAGGRLEDSNATPAIGRDLAVANLVSGSVTVLGDYRNGRFNQGGIIRNAAPAASITPTAVAIGDIDNNGYADLVYADGSGLAVGVVLVGIKARVDSYGTGAAGTGGLTPVLSSLGNQTDATVQLDPRPMLAAPPVVRASTFGLRMSNCRAFSPAVVVLHDGLASPLTAGMPLIGGNSLASWFEVTDVTGNMYVSLPIPNDSVLRGLYLYTQGAVFDPSGTATFFPGLSLSQGLRLRIGDS